MAVDSVIPIDRLVRSKRSTISLEVHPDGKLIVRAPRHATNAEIHALVNAKKAWILKKQALAHKMMEESPPKQFVDGEQFLYLGEIYPLSLVPKQEETLVLNGKFLLATRGQANARQVFEKWYREQAAAVIKPRTAELAERNGYTYTVIRINGAKTRWGSCGPKGSLNFPYRLVMAPLEVIDYVIIHELVHLRIRNHSRKYWDAVGRILPAYRKHIQWLDDNGHLLSID